MALVLTEEQTMLQDSAREFLADRSPVAALRALRDSGSGIGHDPALWSEMAELGWAGVVVSEAYGGQQFGPVGAGLILEEMGRTLCASPFLFTALVAATVLESAGSDALKARYLPELVEGKRLFALAVDETDRHFPDAIQLSAQRKGADLVLNGRKTHVANGMAADTILVAARLADGQLALLVMDSDTPGLSRRGTVTLDAHVSAEFTFENVAVSTGHILGEVSGAGAAVELALDTTRTGLAAELLGISREAFGRTLAYLKEREQFDVPIGSFQALQHRAAEMYCEIELCHSVVLAALHTLESDRGRLNVLASLAKAKASQVARRVSGEAIQMHGGIGMTDDVDIGLYFKRARAAQTAFGDCNFHTQRFATLNGY